MNAAKNANNAQLPFFFRIREGQMLTHSHFWMCCTHTQKVPGRISLSLYKSAYISFTLWDISLKSLGVLGYHGKAANQCVNQALQYMAVGYYEFGIFVGLANYCIHQLFFNSIH